MTKQDVAACVKQKGEKQIFQAVQPAEGKTVAGSLDSRWMMDLIVFVNQTVTVGLQRTGTRSSVPRSTNAYTCVTA